MLEKRFSVLILIVTLISLMLAGQVLAATPTSLTTRISISSNGTQGNSVSIHPSISPDGRYVTFNSNASNLVSGDTNQTIDMFVRDRQTNITKRISVASDGTEGNDRSAGTAAISNDGRYIVFQSQASNLVAGDTNGTSDMFVRDTLANTTKRISIASDGTQGNQVSSSVPGMSADGRYIAFQSFASNLVSGDTNKTQDIFLRDTLTNKTTRISIASDGTQTNKRSDGAPSVSDNGRYIVFESEASNLVSGDTNNRKDIFMRDTLTNQTTRISIASDGTQGNDNSVSSHSAISADGRYVVFSSNANNLVSGGDINGVASDIFVRDILNGITTRVSVASDGTQGNSASFFPSISPDGQYVTFVSVATNLVSNDTNSHEDIFLRDMQRNTTTRISLAYNGKQADNDSEMSDISAAGKYVVFESKARNLVPDDTNQSSDIFIREVVADATPTPTPTTILTPTPKISASSSHHAAALPITGFAPGLVTQLNEQPVTKSYTDQGMTLEIGSLNLKAPIVGVPKEKDGNWDLSWLSGDIGYLTGTTFPTWKGNSVLTAHVYNADGQPGPFVNLDKLSWGKQIIIHAWGQQYIFHVRSVDLQVSPSNIDVLTRHEEYPWLTLITCKGYNEKTNSYQWRTVIRAILVKIEDKP